jgi:hypothetical protein
VKQAAAERAEIRRGELLVELHKAGQRAAA